MQAAPLSVKVSLTKQRIREWVNAWGIDGVYVSFSGGKDSTVLLHIAREMYPEIKAVFINTGLEYPEIVQFVKTFDNVDIIRPKMSFRQVIEKYGYPFISKEVSECVYGARRYLTAVLAEQNAVDRQTDRQIPYAYRLDRLLGTGEFQSRRKNSQTINRSEIYEGGVQQKVSETPRTRRIQYKFEFEKLTATERYRKRTRTIPVQTREFGRQFNFAKLGGGRARDFANLTGIRTVDGSTDPRLWKGYRQFADSEANGDQSDGRQSNDGDYP